MVLNPEWFKPEEKSYFHQTKLNSTHVSLDYIEKLTECVESIDTGEIDCDTCLIMQKILSYEIEDEEYYCLIRNTFHNSPQNIFYSITSFIIKVNV